MGIVWNGYEFGSPRLLRGWQAPEAGGIYAVSYIVRRNNGSRMHRALYFGQSADLSTRGIGPSHEKYECWKRHANGPLHVSIHLERDHGRRLYREHRLVEAYEPVCNEA